MLTGVFRVDSIKKAARKSAWYQSDDDEYKTYNPFGRISNRPRPDVETGAPLHHTPTENDAGPSPMQTERRKQFEGDDEDNIHGVSKSGTYPAGPSGGIPRRSNEKYEEHAIDNSEGSNDSTFNKGSSDQEGVVEHTVSSSNHDDGKVRKRNKARKFMPWKKSQDDGSELEKTDTEDSKKKKKHKKIPILQQFKVVFFSWINILLIAVPVGIGLANAGNINGIVVFVVNFIAIIPLAAMLSFATEELALYVGEVLGGLLNASFGNAVELIVSIIALIQHKILIVQTSLIGSMLSNLLLVLGMCFFFGGLRRTEQYFNVTVAQTAASLLALAIGSLIIPTAFKQFAKEDKGVVPTSRGTSVLLLVTYGCYLLFQLRTHVDMYNEPSQKSPKKSKGKKSKGDAIKSMAKVGGDHAKSGGPKGVDTENFNPHEEEEEEIPQLSVIGALVTLGVSTVFVALCAEYMVSVQYTNPICSILIMF